MPYVPKQERRALVRGEMPMATPGHLNFMLTRLLRLYIRIHGLSYRTINDCLGALEGAKAEFYRRVAAPYEDEAIERNGDVW